MRRTGLILAPLALPLALAAGAAAASDGPMATAGASGAPPVVDAEAVARTRALGSASPAPAPGRPLSTAEQIDAFIQSSPAVRPSPGELAGMDALELEPDRRVHGSFTVGVGSHGYREAGVEAHYPLGKTGHVSVAVGTSRGRGAYGFYGAGDIW